MGCHNESFVMVVIIYYMKAWSLSLQMKFFNYIMETALNVAENYR